MSLNNILDLFKILEKENREVKIKSKEKLKEYINFCFENNMNEHVKFKTSHHHILPQAYFREFKNLKDFSWNGTHLTFKNHYKAHFLLTEAIDDFRMSSAFIRMSHQDVKNGRIHEENLIDEKKFSEICEENARKYSKLFSGIPLKEETKRKMSEVRKGVKKSKEWSRKIGEAQKGNKNHMYGKKQSEESNKKRSEALKGILKGPQKTIECPKCKKIGGSSVMKRWHFENCKVQ